MSLQDQIDTLNANLQGLIQSVRDLGERMDQFSEAAQQMPTKNDLSSIQESIVETNHCLAKIQEEMKNNTYQISNINGSNSTVLTTISGPISSPISNSSNKNNKGNKKKKEMSEQEKMFRVKFLFFFQKKKENRILKKNKNKNRPHIWLSTIVLWRWKLKD